MATTLAVSLLNPHVYLDTIVLLGGIAAQYPADERAGVRAGGGNRVVRVVLRPRLRRSLLAPAFERPGAWRALDVFVGVVMWWIAAGLVWGQLG